MQVATTTSTNVARQGQIVRQLPHQTQRIQQQQQQQQQRATAANVTQRLPDLSGVLVVAARRRPLRDGEGARTHQQAQWQKLSAAAAAASTTAVSTTTATTTTDATTATSMSTHGHDHTRFAIAIVRRHALRELQQQRCDSLRQLERHVRLVVALLQLPRRVVARLQHLVRHHQPGQQQHRSELR